MPSGVEVIGLDECKRDLRKLTADIVDGRGVLRQFWRWWREYAQKQWNHVTAKGGTFRGVRWAPMQHQYKRADGTVVPAWGGVKRVAAGFGLKRKGGTVKGKKRPSGKRVKQTSKMMMDTGAFFRDVCQKPLALTKTYLDVGTSLAYGAIQDAMRKVVFWQPRVDEKQLYRFEDMAIKKAIKKRGFA